jgi:outer membrane beta-barrel protein
MAAGWRLDLPHPLGAPAGILSAAHSRPVLFPPVAPACDKIFRVSLRPALLLVLATLLPAAAWCGEKTSATPQPTATPGQSGDSNAGPEEADVQKIKEKYWARGNEAEVGVVQNRLFSKRHKVELDLTAGGLNGDPFLSTVMLNGELGYHFTEFFSVHAIFGYAFVSPSSALQTLQSQQNTTTNTNNPKYFLASEARASLLYGKISLLGSAILYFDAYLTAGPGYINTESGGDFLLMGGIGQQIHITQTFALDISYRMLWYNETIIGKVSSGPNANLGQNLGRRSNVSNLLTIGFTVLLDPFPDSPKKSG